LSALLVILVHDLLYLLKVDSELNVWLLGDVLAYSLFVILAILATIDGAIRVIMITYTLFHVLVEDSLEEFSCLRVDHSSGALPDHFL
jgi:hypothetical protein